MGCGLWEGFGGAKRIVFVRRSIMFVNFGEPEAKGSRGTVLDAHLDCRRACQEIWATASGNCPEALGEKPCGWAKGGA